MVEKKPDGEHLTREEIQKTIAFTKPLIDKVQRVPFSVRQSKTEKDVPARGPTHVARTSLPASSEAEIQHIIRTTIQDLAEGSSIKYDMPKVEDVECEWISYREGADNKAKELGGSEQQKYEALLKNATSDTVILFTAGGACTSNAAPTYRPFLTSLARITGGRVLNVKKRLAPANPFPAQLIDLLLAYLILLYPPPGSFHTAVSPSNIILAGNSTGANVILSLTQLIAHFNAHASPTSGGSSSNPFSHTPSPTLIFADRAVPLPQPAGVLALSLAPETHPSLPSWPANIPYDLFATNAHPALDATFPPCALWPTTPPREHIYSSKEMLPHPLNSPTTTRDWSGCPPVYTDIGSRECCTDGARVIQRRMRQQGVAVLYDVWEDMPHDFFMFFPAWWQSRALVRRAGEVCNAFVEAARKGRRVESEGTWWSVEGQRRGLDLDSLKTLEWEEARRMIRESAERLDVWTGGGGGADVKRAKM